MGNAHKLFYSVPQLAFAASVRMREQWLDREGLADLRSRRLHRTLERATRSTYYQDILRRLAIDPKKFAEQVRKDERTLGRLPLLEKTTYRSYPIGAFLTEPADGLFAVKTSGSTGEPTGFLRSNRDQANISSIWARLHRTYGRRPFDRQVNIASGRTVARSGPLATLRKLHLVPTVHQVSSFEPMDIQIATLRRLRPQILSGYGIGIELLAEAVLERHVTDIRPRVIFTSGMQLSERARRLCKDAFGVPAYDVYGTNENGVIAWECPVNSGALHANDDVMYVEIVDDDGLPVADGIPGRIAITPLLVTALPLLRYVVGDVGARMVGPCPCGRGLGLMERVHGRTKHIIRLNDGHLITAPLISAIFAWIPEVLRYQVRETAPGAIQVLVVPAQGKAGDVAAAVQQGFNSRIPGIGQVEVVATDDLPLAPSGKFQTIVPFDQS